MEIFKTIGQTFVDFFRNIGDTFIDVLPGLLLLLACVAVAFIVSFLFRILIRVTGLSDRLEGSGFMKKMHEMGIESKAHKIFGTALFWILLLIFFESVSDVRGWTSVSFDFKNFFHFIPLLIGSIIIVVFGWFISRFLKKSINTLLTGSSAADIISKVSYYILMAIVITIALGHLGMNTNIITTNISILVGTVFLSFALAFVFAAKGILGDILSAAYNRKNFKVGQIITLGEGEELEEGEIIKITNISVIVKMRNKIRVIPAKKLTEEIVEIHG